MSGIISDDVPYEIWEFEAFTGETLTITMTATALPPAAPSTRIIVSAATRGEPRRVSNGRTYR